MACELALGNWRGLTLSLPLKCPPSPLHSRSGHCYRDAALRQQGASEAVQKGSSEAVQKGSVTQPSAGPSINS